MKKFLIPVMAFATIILTGCNPWVEKTPFNVGIVGDKEIVEERCSGKVEVGENGYFLCNHGTGTRWSPAIPGDYENAVAECDGNVVEVGAYYACVKP